MRQRLGCKHFRVSNASALVQPITIVRFDLHGLTFLNVRYFFRRGCLQPQVDELALRVLGFEENGMLFLGGDLPTHATLRLPVLADYAAGKKYIFAKDISDKFVEIGK